MPAGLSLQTGIVVAVRQPAGEPPVVDVRSDLDLTIIPDIRIDTPLFAQQIPVVGQYVFLMRDAGFVTRIVAVFGERPFDAPVTPGEVMVESTGGSFLYLNNSGDAMLSDETLSNVLKLISKIGVLIVGDTFSLNVKGVGQINITPQREDLGTEDVVELVKLGNSGQATATIRMTNEKIVIDGGRIEIGRASDALKGGAVVSLSGLIGEYSFDSFGRPVPGSAVVRASVLETP